MATLTQRQIQILKAVIEEYIETAEAVASDTIEKKYNLGVSPATIRNEMVSLTKLNYLHQPHISAGRTPTSQGLKFYVRNLLIQEELSVADEVSAKEKMWDHRQREKKLIYESTKLLAEKTQSIAMAITSEGDAYHAGYANILSLPEFLDIDVTKSVLSLLDEIDYLDQLFSYKTPVVSHDVSILIGEDLGYEYLETCGLIHAPFKTPHLTGHLGILGSNRFNYGYVIPLISHVSHLISDMTREK